MTASMGDCLTCRSFLEAIGFNFREPEARVLLLEWREENRPESRGLTSHSFLEAHISDGRRLRMELFWNTGYVETMSEDEDSEDTRSRPSEGTVYDGRVASRRDFIQGLTVEKLEKTARSVGNSRPYSLSDFNCHHFALQVWNSLVKGDRRATDYPDQQKSNVLKGLEDTFGILLPLQVFQSSTANSDQTWKSARKKKNSCSSRRSPQKFRTDKPCAFRVTQYRVEPWENQTWPVREFGRDR